MQALLAQGASLDAANTAGITALINAAFFGHDPVVQLLLQRGANARAVDKKRRAALHWAALNDNDAVRTFDYSLFAILCLPAGRVYREFMALCRAIPLKGECGFGTFWC